MHILNFISFSIIPATSFLAIDAAKAETLKDMWVRVYSLSVLCFLKPSDLNIYTLETSIPEIPFILFFLKILNIIFHQFLKILDEISVFLFSLGHIVVRYFFVC